MQQIIDRLRSEFLEMPGLRLTAAQVQRFCGIDPGLCQTVLDALVDSNFLRKGSDGSYAWIGDHPSPRMAKADLAEPASIHGLFGGVRRCFF